MNYYRGKVAVKEPFNQCFGLAAIAFGDLPGRRAANPPRFEVTPARGDVSEKGYTYEDAKRSRGLRK